MRISVTYNQIADMQTIHVVDIFIFKQTTRSNNIILFASRPFVNYVYTSQEGKQEITIILSKSTNFTIKIKHEQLSDLIKNYLKTVPYINLVIILQIFGNMGSFFEKQKIKMKQIKHEMYRIEMAVIKDVLKKKTKVKV